MHFTLAHEESKKKSDRISSVWSHKKRNAKDKPITSLCPAWLEVVDGQFKIKREAAAIVRTIFARAVDGHGADAIVKWLNGSKVPTIGKVNYWHRSYINKILQNRAVIGEYQPHRQFGGRYSPRVPDGDPIEGYYPAIVDRTLFYKVQKDRAVRHFPPGRNGDCVSNLFKGLIRDARDGTTMVLTEKAGKRIVSSGARRGQGKYMSFPYLPFEQALLQWTAELSPNDLGGMSDNAETDQHDGRLAEVEVLIAKLKKRLKANPELDDLLDMVQDLNHEKRDLVAKIKAARGREPIDKSQAIIAQLAKAKGDDLTTLRTRLRMRIRELIDSIWVLVVGHQSVRYAVVQVQLRNGQSRKIQIACRRGETADFGDFDAGPVLGIDLREWRDHKDYNELARRCICVWDRLLVRKPR